MKVIVFGGTGFLGCRIAQRLSEAHHDVAVLTRSTAKIANSTHSKIQFIKGDMTLGEYPALETFDVIINCAGELSDEARMPNLHVDAVRLAIESIGSQQKPRWVQISSVGVYGLRSHGVIEETDEFAPEGVYEITKAEAELLVVEMCLAKGIPYTIIRPSNVFGNNMPNQSLRGLILAIVKDRFFYMGQSRNYKLNYVHVDDVCLSVCRAIESDLSINEDFIVSDVIGVIEFVDLIKSLAGKNSSVPTVPLAWIRTANMILGGFDFWPLSESRIQALSTEVVYSSFKSQKILNFTHQVGVVAGLKAYCKFLGVTKHND